MSDIKMPPDIKISIVTPVLNSVGTIGRCLESVFGQRPFAYEHIVVDGGSTDGSVDILNREAGEKRDFLFVQSEPDRGIAEAFNKGIHRCRGDYIGIINADDWYEDGVLAAITPHLSANRIIHGQLRLHNQQTGVSRVSGRNDYDPKRHFKPLEKMPAQHPSCIVPANVYRRIGGYRDSFTLAMDYDFLLRAHLDGVEFFYTPRVIANFSRTGRSSQKSGFEVSEREVLAAQILNTGHVGGPIFNFFKRRVQGWMRRTRRRLLGRPKV